MLKVGNDVHASGHFKHVLLDPHEQLSHCSLGRLARGFLNETEHPGAALAAVGELEVPQREFSLK